MANQKLLILLLLCATFGCGSVDQVPEQVPEIVKNRIYSGNADLALFYFSWKDIRFSEPWIGDDEYATKFRKMEFEAKLDELITNKTVKDVVVFYPTNIDSVFIRELDVILKKRNCKNVLYHPLSAMSSKLINYRYPVAKKE